MKKLTLGLLLVIMSTVFFAPTSQANPYYGTAYNGYKIYLSPANHDGIDKFGCDSFSEINNAKALTTQVKNVLTSMGYAVYIGSGGATANTTQSNNWGSDLHVPIHSNAKGSFNATVDCKNTNLDYGASGTLVMHNVNKSSTAASAVLNRLKNLSPGRGYDKVDSDKAIVGSNLYELSATKMPSAYVEVGFHTFRPDMEWMRDQKTSIATAIAGGIHNFTGAKDCRVSACPITTTDLEEEIAQLKEFVYEDKVLELDKFGYINTYIEADITKLLLDQFDSSLSEALNGVYIDNNGTVAVDFKHFGYIVGNPSLIEKANLVQELNKVIFEHSQVNEIYYTFEGNLTSFGDWTEFGEITYKRDSFSDRIN
ncbi:hypothetical protein HNO89_003204 [Sporosarcina luteola]|nr:hypothetical protein [Sporosarcina luteola]